jgi:serine kinase of HPr protein (carbohydrate metabolism regulator)
MPVAPGRNIALLVEVAARNQLLKDRGYDAARRFTEQVDELIQQGGEKDGLERRAGGGRSHRGRQGPP